MKRLRSVGRPLLIMDRVDNDGREREARDARLSIIIGPPIAARPSVMDRVGNKEWCNSIGGRQRNMSL